MWNSRVVVVGTTADYIHILRRQHPGRAVFLTDRAERERAVEPDPDPVEETLCDLADPADARCALDAHLRQWGVRPSGVACFDDESLALASTLADGLHLPFVSPEAVAACRSKFACKQRWRQAGVPCPRAALVASEDQAVAFARDQGGPVVLKPLSGSGSELTFFCRNEAECAGAFRVLLAKIREHPDVRLYAPQPGDETPLDPRRVFVAEEHVAGVEYSCDFLIAHGDVALLRLAGKVLDGTQSFGTTLAYVVPAELPGALDPKAFARQLRRAAQALAVTRSICMVDFIVRGAEAVLIEMAPRPGGDCLPPLLMHGAGFDILGAALDFAEGRAVRAPKPSAWQRTVGLRIFSSRAGTITSLDADELRNDPSVRECHLKHGPGHRVIMPPEDYDSRLLGHVIFQPAPGDDVEAMCRELCARVDIRMEPSPCPTPTSF